MLVSVYLPFSDYRSIMVDGFARLSRPAWPILEDFVGAHVRNIGSIQYRRKPGFEGWVGEDRLAFGVNALALLLPRSSEAEGLGTLRVIRKACYFDGLLNGRIELLFGANPKEPSRVIAFEAARRLLDVKVKVAQCGFEDMLRAASPAIGKLWAESTIKHGQQAHLEWMRAGRPICIVESDFFLGKTGDDKLDKSDSRPMIDLAVAGGKKPVELILISPNGTDSGTVQRGSSFRLSARYVRTYLLRLLQDAESLSILFSLPLDSVDSDTIQNLFNEYTWRISRARQRMEQFDVGPIIEYCYSAFDRVFPGRVDAIRVRLINSKMRPNIKRKMLQFLEIVEASSVKVQGNLVLGDEVQGDKLSGDKIMGDKYENLDISGQGVAIGRGAQATVQQSTNAPNTAAIAEALGSLAELVRKQSGHADADVEATLVEAAAEKAKKGDEQGAVGILKKSAGWVLDLAKSAGSAVLVAFLKLHFGIG